MVLTQNFQKEVINTKFKSENSMSNIIKRLSGEIVEDFDTYIDDGADDDDTENDYVMCSVFATRSYIFRVFYGDIDNIIGYASVQKL
jgi:hypothetical protein